MPVGWEYSRDGPERRAFVGATGEKMYLTKRQTEEHLAGSIRFRNNLTKRIKRIEKGGQSAKKLIKIRDKTNKGIRSVRGLIKRWK